MVRALGDGLLHLHAAGAAFGRADLDVVVAEAVQQAPTGSEGGPKIVPAEPEGAGHARAAAVDELHAELGDRADQVEARRADAEGAEVARLVISDPGVEGVGGPWELPAGLESREVLAN